MLCIDTIGKLIKDEIKFNVKVCSLNQEWLRDKEVILLDTSLNVFDIYGVGEVNFSTIKRNSNIQYVIIKCRGLMYLANTRDGHFMDAYRSTQTAIWDHYSDLNKLGEDWWTKFLARYYKKYNRFKTNLTVATNYKFDLERWLVRGEGSNYFTEEVRNELRLRLSLVNEALESFKEVEEDDNRSTVCEEPSQGA